ncbi:hypothetical protein HYX04_00940 [Candidatus Woesearchaeota archaeon]|nr:hypothetical protein [Candidatus Woesearchaeota archaeon]
MKKAVFLILLLTLLFQSFSVFAAQINSASYKQNVIVSTGGENLSSASYKIGVATGIINRIINSSSYINRLGFFYTWLLADGQPCASDSQCEGGFCCSSLCQSSSCPTAPAPSGGAAAAAAAGGGGGGIAAVEEKDFSVSPASITEQLVLGAAKIRTITITNTGSAALQFNLNVLTVDEFVFLSDTSFSLGPAQEKTVEASIVGRRLGSYLGEIEIAADGIKKSVTVVIDVESEQVLFDVKVDIPKAYKEVEPGKELRAQITLLNVGPPKKVDVTPTYIIKDKQGRFIHESSETFAVEKQLSYAKSFNIPKEALPGEYLLVVEVRYANTFAVSSDLFNVVLKKEVLAEEFVKQKSRLILILVILGALTSLLIYLFVIKRRSGRRLERCRRAINNAKDALGRNDIYKAKQFYAEARNLYNGLKAQEKKEVYSSLMWLYDKLK